MHDLVVDLAKEIVVGLMSLALGAIGHFVRGVARDLNAFFQKVRCLEARVEKLETERGKTCKGSSSES